MKEEKARSTGKSDKLEDQVLDEGPGIGMGLIVSYAQALCLSSL